MARYYCGAAVFAILIALFTTSLGWCDMQQENQNVLVNSKIKKSSFKKIFQDIKKTLPKELRQCPIVVTDVKLLKQKNGGVAEDWTVNICQETKDYFISTFHPKGYFCEVVLKEDQFAHEKKLWNAVKNDTDADEWRAALFYVDEIEATDQDEFGGRVRN